ncbi:MAG TPA: NAD(P)/FAD-dependent oxidoreductase [Thermoanaerobaculales bacterium]|nr:NAD(P)/FAD-dependent oxidoreductase [Thermoanaerobaculales bacterium]HPA81023.1 NAD(P)/FAD-dependent oxidoreductase [Thermoanaerobaculales bacterium]HQL29406.1 NAD(P)/FAD-dependent oxidoreductase [Thermoanaerobaculales bacterium]
MGEIAVVGAGLSGLTAALRLAERGHRVRIYERYPRPGGLARVLEVGGEPLEAFYHHLFTSDRAAVALAEELGVGDLLEWLPSRMGIWTEGRLWDFGTPVSLLRFRPLNPVDKLRFVLATLRLQYTGRYQQFENVTAVEWIRRTQGERVWRTVWGPLFHQKFADRAEQVAMVWLWGKLRLRGRSRSESGLGERLGYMRGSFARLITALEGRIAAAGGQLCLSEPVRRVERADGRFQVVTRSGAQPADRVVVAAPVPDHIEIAGHLLDPQELGRLQGLQATAAICTVLELSRSLTPFYWLNIADPEMPFGGLIEHTNYIPRDRYGGRHILYISNYLFPDHPLYRANKEEVLNSYLPALQRVNPSFDRSWILASHHFHADYAQPVVTRGYREQIPGMRTSVTGLYLCCMAQIFPEDRGMNYAIAYGDRVARLVLEDLRGARGGAAGSEAAPI